MHQGTAYCFLRGEEVDVTDLERLAELIRAHNTIDEGIAAITGRPAERGHTGEYIAAMVFGISLLHSASHKGIDGHFVGGSLAGKSVNVKWYGKHDGLVALQEDPRIDYHLVLTGEKRAPASSRGTSLPWSIDYVFVFDAQMLLAALRARGTRLGVATSVQGYLWEQAEVYPVQRNPVLTLSEEQRRQLALFRWHTA